MNELINLDPTFTESAFKTQIDNMFVMLHMSYMTSNLKRVAHFISKDVYEEYEKKLEELNSKNLRQMYDELNVKSTDIVDIKTIASLFNNNFTNIGDIIKIITIIPTHPTAFFTSDMLPAIVTAASAAMLPATGTAADAANFTARSDRLSTRAAIIL